MIYFFLFHSTGKFSLTLWSNAAATIVQLFQTLLPFPLFYRISSQDDCTAFLKELWQLERINDLHSLDYHSLYKVHTQKTI